MSPIEGPLVTHRLIYDVVTFRGSAASVGASLRVQSFSRLLKRS